MRELKDATLLGHQDWPCWIEKKAQHLCWRLLASSQWSLIASVPEAYVCGISSDELKGGTDRAILYSVLDEVGLSGWHVHSPSSV